MALPFAVGMEGEHSGYVSQLKLQFAACDTTSSGFLDQDELTELCRRLQLETHMQQLLDTLLQPHNYGRVNFEEFQQGLVAVLSGSLEFSSEDDSSYLEPAVPQEVQPKMVKGSKRYGRRSHPEVSWTYTSQSPCGDTTMSTDSSPAAVRRAKLRRAMSVESVESLKSEEEQRRSTGDHQEAEVAGCSLITDQERHLQGTREDDSPPFAHRHPPMSVQEFGDGLADSACSTPAQSADLQKASRKPLESPVVLEAEPWASPSLFTATVGQRVLSRLDDGFGCTSPERVAMLWTEEGVPNASEILQILDFSLDERLSLTDLTLALDNELLLSGNGVYQAALVSYKNEIQHMQDTSEAACRQRDKLKADLDQADHRNLQLVREVDDRHASIEALNRSRVRELEQDFRDKLAALRHQVEQESEALLQQAEREHTALQEELQLLRAQEAELKEETRSAALENERLHQELNNVKLQLRDAQDATDKLHGDLQQLLHHKLEGLDPAGAAFSHQERFTEIIKEYELQCRELRDRNDELSSELELLKSQRRVKGAAGTEKSISWSQHTASTHLPHNTESDSDDSDMKRGSSPVRKMSQLSDDKTELQTGVSIQTELALEQLKQKHKEELQQLNIQLETQVNFYERSLELMRQSVEVERKDISQAFKLEISELEEQKCEVEQQVKQLKETVDKLSSQLQRGGGGAGWNTEQERRMQRERAELEQNFAKEISHLVQRLSAEKEQLEAELKLKMDQEVQLVRSHDGESGADEGDEELHEEAAENGTTSENQEFSSRRCSELEAQPEESISSLESQTSAEEERRHSLSVEEPLQEERCGPPSRAAAQQEAPPLPQEARRTCQPGPPLEEQQKEVCRLEEENRRYMQLVDQLSSQIVEMEEEMGSLRELLRDLSSQLGVSSDLVLELRTQLNARSGEDKLRMRAEEEFEEEKLKMRRQLEKMEQLVLELEAVTGDVGRSQLEEVRSENAALQERLHLLQLEVQTLEEDVDKRRRRLQEMEREHQRSREEEERLQQENARCREEALEMSSRNLQLSNDNAALSARLRGDQEAVRMLQERLATLSKEKEEHGGTVRRLQDAALQMERDKQQLQAACKYDKQLLEGELSRCREQLARWCDLEAELRTATLKLSLAEDDKTKLLRDADERRDQVEELRRTLVSMETEAERYRSQLNQVVQEKLSHGQQVLELQRKLKDAESREELLEQSMRRLKEAQEEQEEQSSIALQEETHHLRVQNQELQNQALSLVQAQQLWQRQEVQQQESSREEVELLQLQLEEAQRRSQQLEEALRLQSHRRDSQMSLKQEQYEKALLALQHRSEELHVKLRGVRLLLQEKVQQLKEELVNGSRCGARLKDSLVENAQLMKALSVTEQRQKQAEKKNVQLEEKVGALQQLLREVVMATLAT